MSAEQKAELLSSDDAQDTPGVVPVEPIPMVSASDSKVSVLPDNSHNSQPQPQAFGQGTSVEQLEQMSSDSQPMEADLAEPVIATNMEDHADPADSQTVNRLAEEKANLERQYFIVNEELTDIKRQYTDVATQNTQLQAQIQSNAGELNERIRLYRMLEASRDDLSLKKTQAEERAEKYKKEKEERDGIIRNITKERHNLNAENVALKGKIKEALQEKSEALSDKKLWEQERHSLTYELHRARDEKTLFADGKKWLMREIADRDCKISELRIEMSKKEVSWQNEKSRVMEENAELVDKVTELEASISRSKDELKEKIAFFTKEMEQKQRDVESAESELLVREQIAHQLREELQEANRLLKESSLTSSQMQKSVREAEEQMMTLHKEMAVKEEELEKDMKEKESKILDLEDELEKANDALKNAHKLPMTDEDMAQIAPLAAETSRLLKSGMTLTQLYREYARVLGEKEQLQLLNKSMEEDLHAIIRDVEEHAPNLNRQKQQLREALDTADKLNSQLDQAREESRSLTQQKDSAARELAFTKIELEKFQREHTKLKQHAAQLLFVHETETHGADSPPLDHDEQQQMFTSIVGLQQRNVQLQLELENAQRSIHGAIESAHNAEAERLRNELQSTRRELDVVKQSLTKLTTAMNSIEQQRDRYKDIVERGGLDPEAAKLRKEVDRLQAELETSQNKYSLLEEHIKNVREEHSKMQGIWESRLSHQTALNSQLEQTKTRLQSSLDMQQQVAAETKNELDKIVVTMRKQSENLEKARKQVTEADLRVSNTNQTLMEKQSQISSLLIENRTLGEDLQSCRNSLSRTEGELSALRESMRNNDRLVSVLRDAEMRLQHSDESKLSRLQSQLEHAELERDQLSISNSTLKDQVAGLRKEMAANEVRLCGEHDLTKAQLADVRAQLNSAEKLNAELRTNLASTQAQYATVDAARGTNPERLAKENQQLRNRNTYLEAQVEEMRAKLTEAEGDLAKRAQEVEQLSTMSGTIESTLKEQTTTSLQESQRLQGLLQSAQARHDDLVKELNNLRDELRKREDELRANESAFSIRNTELSQRIAVLEVQLGDAESTVTNQNGRLREQNTELSNATNKIMNLENELSVVEGDRAVLVTTIEELNTQIEQKDSHIQSAESRIAEEIRMRELALESAEKRANEIAEKVKEQEEKAKVTAQRTEELVQQIEKLSTCLAARESGASSEHADTDEGMESMNSVVRFLREEKQMALERSMQAEVEMKRLAAETQELRSERDRMAERLRQRDLEAEQNAAALAQRSELMARLEGMTSAQRENVQLKAENARYDRMLQEATQKKDELEKQSAELRILKRTAEERAASLQSLADTTLRQLEASKAKHAEQTSRIEKIKQLTVELQTVRSQADQARHEADMAKAEIINLNQRLQKAESQPGQAKGVAAPAPTAAKLADLEKKFSSAKGLAIKYRDESKKFKELLVKNNISFDENIAAEAARTSAMAETVADSPVRPSLAQRQVEEQLQERMSKMEEEKKALDESIAQERASHRAVVADLEREKEESTMRANMMDKMMGATKSRLEAVQRELAQLKAAHEKTVQELESCRSGSGSSSATQAVPAAPTMSTSSTAASFTFSSPTKTTQSSVPAAPTASQTSSSLSSVPPAPQPQQTTSTFQQKTTLFGNSGLFQSQSSGAAPSLFKQAPTQGSSLFGNSAPINRGLFGASAPTVSIPTTTSTPASTVHSSSPAPAPPTVSSFFGSSAPESASRMNRTSPFISTPSSTTASLFGAPADPAPGPLHRSDTAPRSHQLELTEPEDSIKQAQQPDTVSGTDDQRGSVVTLKDEDSLSCTDGGASQDGLPSAISSSSGLHGRKRGASTLEASTFQEEVKRLRESPGEDQITSSERNNEQVEVLDDETTRDAEAVVELDDEEEDEELEEQDDEGEEEEMGDEDELEIEEGDGEAEELPEMLMQPPHAHQLPQMGQSHPMNVAGAKPDEPITLDSDSDDGEGYGVNEEDDDDEGEGMDEENFSEEPDFDEENVQELSSDDEGDVKADHEGEEGESDQEDDGLQTDEQTQDADNVLDDTEEREAASAVEEADDEGREPEQGVGEVAQHQQHGIDEESDSAQPSQSSAVPKRQPISFDICTSSNEGAQSIASSSQSQPPRDRNTGRAPRGRANMLHHALGQVHQQQGQGSSRAPQMARRGQTAKRFMRGARPKK